MSNFFSRSLEISSKKNPDNTELAGCVQITKVLPLLNMNKPSIACFCKNFGESHFYTIFAYSNKILSFQSKQCLFLSNMMYFLFLLCSSSNFGKLY